jgi:rRNA maturation endonuclease Nob1
LGSGSFWRGAWKSILTKINLTRSNTMAKLRELNISGQRLVCDRCCTVYIKGLAGWGKVCPKCGGNLILKELTDREHGNYEADERSM